MQADPSMVGLKRALTKPKSPTLQTVKRMKMKDDIASADKINEDHSQEFKARPFNKKIFD